MTQFFFGYFKNISVYDRKKKQTPTYRHCPDSPGFNTFHTSKSLVFCEPIPASPRSLEGMTQD